MLALRSRAAEAGVGGWFLNLLSAGRRLRLGLGLLAWVWVRGVWVLSWQTTSGVRSASGEATSGVWSWGAAGGNLGLSALSIHGSWKITTTHGVVRWWSVAGDGARGEDEGVNELHDGEK